MKIFWITLGVFCVSMGLYPYMGWRGSILAAGVGFLFCSLEEKQEE